MTVITPTRRTEWIPALASLRRQGVNIAVVYVDPTEFGAAVEPQSPLDFLFANEIPVYRVKRGQSFNEALQMPLYAGESYRYPAPPAAAAVNADGAFTDGATAAAATPAANGEDAG